MKQTANMRKNATSFRPKKHQHENTSEASDFLCTRFQMSTKHLEPVMTIRNQYMFLQEVEKKDNNSPSRKQKKCTHKSSYFSPNCKFEVFLDKSTNYNDCWNKPFQKTRRKDSLSWIPDHSKVRKKIHF